MKRVCVKRGELEQIRWENLSKNNKIIDFRPFTQDGSELFRYQAIKQFKLYTGIEYEYS